MTTPYLPGGEEFKWRTKSYRASKDLILVQTVQLKPMIKAYSSGKMVSSSISDVVIASVNSEKTRLKMLMMMMMKIIIIIIMKKSQETTVFSGRQKLTSAMILAIAKKVKVDFKFDALYR